MIKGKMSNILGVTNKLKMSAKYIDTDHNQIEC